MVVKGHRAVEGAPESLRALVKAHREGSGITTPMPVFVRACCITTRLGVLEGSNHVHAKLELRLNRGQQRSRNNGSLRVNRNWRHRDLSLGIIEPWMIGFRKVVLRARIVSRLGNLCSEVPLLVVECCGAIVATPKQLTGLIETQGDGT